MKNIEIDSFKFKKTSKKLLDIINSKTNNLFKLNEIQECLAISLGYRNLFELQQQFNNNENNDLINIKSSHKNLLNILTQDEIINLILLFINHDHENDFWKARVISLISTIIMALIFLKNEKEIVLNVDIIREYLFLDNIIKLYKNKKNLPEHIKNALKTYLISLPEFQENENKQSETTLEQHGYLQMQLIRILNNLEIIDKNNYLLIKKSWIKENKSLSLYMPFLENEHFLKMISFIEKEEIYFYQILKLYINFLKLNNNI